MENIEKTKERKDEVIEALMNEDTKVQAQAAVDYMDQIAKELAEKFEEVKETKDASILAGRGFRQLTGEEKKQYEKIIEAMKSPNVKEALTNVNVVFPITTINEVFEDLEQTHPLLSEIDFQNVTGLTEFLVKTGDVDTAIWGPLCADVTKELSAGFDKITVNLYKLSAFLPTCKAYLDLGPTWLDAFVRAVLRESLANGLETGIITGDGNEMPIGMDRDLEGAVVGGVYPQKTAVAFNDFNDLLARVSNLTNGGKRKATGVIFIVNPVDYLTKVLPTTQFLTAGGVYTQALPYPVKFIESTAVSQGSAIIGIGKKYFLGAGSERKIDYSDHVRFFEDERVYITKIYANGKPKDNTSFILLDISGLTGTLGLPVNVTNTPAKPVNTKEAA